MATVGNFVPRRTVPFPPEGRTRLKPAYEVPSNERFESLPLRHANKINNLAEVASGISGGN
jgi:hypothetical protein